MPGHGQIRCEQRKRLHHTSKTSYSIDQHLKKLKDTINTTSSGVSADSRLRQVEGFRLEHLKGRKPTIVDEYERLIEEAKKKDEKKE
jgi:hypothetical protein